MILKLHCYPAKVSELKRTNSTDISFLYSIDTRRFESGATTVLIESRWCVELTKLQWWQSHEELPRKANASRWFDTAVFSCS